MNILLITTLFVALCYFGQQSQIAAGIVLTLMWLSSGFKLLFWILSHKRFIRHVKITFPANQQKAKSAEVLLVISNISITLAAMLFLEAYFASAAYIISTTLVLTAKDNILEEINRRNKMLQPVDINNK